MKQSANKWITYVFCALFGALVCFASLILPSVSGPLFSLRQNANGGFWFSFGPGVISSCNCRSIDVSLGDRRNRIQVTDSKKISEIKKWILDNKFDQQFDQSPLWPRNIEGLSIAPAYYLWLYDSADIDASNQFKYSIIFIPLEPLAMGVDEQQWRVKIGELKILLGMN